MIAPSILSYSLSEGWCLMKLQFKATRILLGYSSAAFDFRLCKKLWRIHRNSPCFLHFVAFLSLVISLSLERAKIVSIIKKYHNHKMQTNPWHQEEEPHNNYETPGRQTKQSNQPSFPHQDDCKIRRDIKKRTTKHRTIKESHNRSFQIL